MVTITHAKVVSTPDDGTSDVGSDEWNADHVISGSLGRISLSANTTYHVATTGSDTTGDGSVGNPWKTLQHASDYIAGAIDLAGFTLTVQIADGTYDGFVAQEFFSSTQDVTAFSSGFSNSVGAPIIFAGNVADHTKVVIGPCPGFFDAACILQIASPSTVTFIKNVTIDASALAADAGAIFILGSGATFIVGDGTGGTVKLIGSDGTGIGTGGDAVTSLNYAAVTACDNIIITGIWDYIFRADASASLIVGLGSATTVTSSGTTHSIGNFANSGGFGGLSILTFAATTFVGTFTGSRFGCSRGAILDTGALGQGFTVLPGDSTGTTTLGGTVIFNDSTNSPNSSSNFIGIVADLPPVAVVPVGTRAFVTDSNATLAAGIGNIVATGASNKVPVYSDGTNWRIG